LFLSLVPILLLEYPHTPMMTANIAWSRHLDDFGRFVSSPEHIERVGSFPKVLEATGYHVIIVTLSRLLAADPILLNVYLPPVLYSIYIPLVSFLVIRTVLPERTRLALFAALGVLLSQHVVFLLVPPGKPETLAFVFFLLTLFSWVLWLRGPIFKSIHLYSAILFTLATVVVHGFVGIYALVLAGTAIYLRTARPLEKSVSGPGSTLLRRLGYLALVTISSLALFLVYQLSTSLRIIVQNLSPSFDTTELASAVFLRFVLDAELTLAGLRDFYLAWFDILWLVLAFIGITLAWRRGMDRRFVWLVVPLIVISFSFMFTEQFLFERQWGRPFYRFLYYLNFVTFPFVALTVAVGLQRFLKGRSSGSLLSNRHRFLRRSKIGLALVLLSTIIAVSVYGGFPRAGTLGPYEGGPVFVSKFDVLAMASIADIEMGSERTFSIIGDGSAVAAASLIFGFRVNIIEGRSQPIVSPYDENADLWTIATRGEPFIFFEVALETLRNDVVYLVLTYRLGDSLRALADAYSRYVPMLFGVPEKVYVFSFTSD
ncbi:MAG: hypothetical protein ACE5KH_03675, partial [Candidatus Geothermarchaeales archaeon]